MYPKFLPPILGTALISSDPGKTSLRRVLFLLALWAPLLLRPAPADAADINISNPQYPVTPATDIGWNPGMTRARAIHWEYVGLPAYPANDGWYQYWGSCPDDNGGCSGFAMTAPQYQADFAIYRNGSPCRPNTGEPVNVSSYNYGEFNGLPCPIYANWYGWFGNSSPKSYSAGINNYPWNRWNSPNIWVGLGENKWRTVSGAASLDNRRLDNALLSFNLTAYLSRTYVQNGKPPRGQGRILIGFTFFGANGINYIVEMNLSNMRVNLNDGRATSDFPGGAPMIPVSNPWRDDIWGEAITPNASTPPREYVIGARNWGYNLIEGQTQSVFFDPWWVAVNLMYPPPDCPKMLNHDGTPTTTYDDPAGYGFIPCGNRNSLKLPSEALFDANGQPAAIFEGFYVGVEMSGTAVNGKAGISNWRIQSRW